VIANIGVHGTKVDLHLERLSSHNVVMLKTVQSHKIDAKLLITHRFQSHEILDAYETFSHAARTRALKVIVAA
jgi:alcohol dehydrogenase